MTLSRRSLLSGLAALLLAPPDLIPHRRFWALGAMPHVPVAFMFRRRWSDPRDTHDATVWGCVLTDEEMRILARGAPATVVLTTERGQVVVEACAEANQPDTYMAFMA